MHHSFRNSQLNLAVFLFAFEASKYFQLAYFYKIVIKISVTRVPEEISFWCALFYKAYFAKGDAVLAAFNLFLIAVFESFETTKIMLVLVWR